MIALHTVETKVLIDVLIYHDRCKGGKYWLPIHLGYIALVKPATAVPCPSMHMLPPPRAPFHPGQNWICQKMHLAINVFAMFTLYLTSTGTCILLPHKTDNNCFCFGWIYQWINYLCSFSTSSLIVVVSLFQCVDLNASRHQSDVSGLAVPCLGLFVQLVWYLFSFHPD